MLLLQRRHRSARLPSPVARGSGAASARAKLKRNARAACHPRKRRMGGSGFLFLYRKSVFPAAGRGQLVLGGPRGLFGIARWRAERRRRIATAVTTRRSQFVVLSFVFAMRPRNAGTARHPCKRMTGGSGFRLLLRKKARFRGSTTSDPEGLALGDEQFRDGALGAVEHAVEGFAVEDAVFAGALDFDEGGAAAALSR